MLSIQQRVLEASEQVRKAWQTVDGQAATKPEVIIITGSGLGAIADKLDPLVFEMSYDEIPHVPKSGMKGHAGRLLIGHYGGAGGKKVAVLDGRVHGYEGHDPLTQVLPLLVANELCEGASLALLTNAAGAINESYHVGEIMLIADHINLTGQSLVEFNDESDFGGSNLDMSFVYTPAHRRTLDALAHKKDISLYMGVYIGVKGAMFETPAEIQAFRKWGADAVGMSTVHEATAASRLGIDVVGFSVLTNMAAGIEAKRLTQEEVLEETAKASALLGELIEDFLATLE